jgi:AcrR family transcriptional regulator
MAEHTKRTSQRSYRMGRRRDQLDAMRQRIAEAAFELHRTVGPAQTSISAVAEAAGVQRHTVYHHFPDMTSLMRACTEHGMLVTLTPNAAPWLAIEDPATRLRHGLAELYAYYRTNARLLGNVVRDMPLLAEAGIGGSEPFIDRMGQLFGALADGWPGDTAAQRLRMVTIGHAMAYETWRSLTSAGATDDEAVGLMVGLVEGVARQNGSVSSHPPLVAPLRRSDAARSPQRPGPRRLR